MAKLKNSNCDKTKKNKWWPNLNEQIVTKLKNSNLAKLKKINCDNSRTQIVIVIKMTVLTGVVIMTTFSKNTLTPWQPSNSQGSFSQFLRCFSLGLPLCTEARVSVIASWHAMALLSASYKTFFYEFDLKRETYCSYFPSVVICPYLGKTKASPRLLPLLVEVSVYLYNAQCIM